MNCRYFIKPLLLVMALLGGPQVGLAKQKNEDIPRTLSSLQREKRLLHAQELLGKYYPKSTVRVGEDVPKINKMVYRWTFQRLSKRYKKDYQKIAQAIIDVSLKYEFDPVFLMSVIQGESSFDPRKKGKVGEIGLMQIRPTTGEWIAGKYNLPWRGKKSLYDPITNIRLGAAYLDFLRARFDSHARLYLAAYNMGQRNVDIALSNDIWPKDYPIHVMRHYVDFYSNLKDRQETQDGSEKQDARI